MGFMKCVVYFLFQEHHQIFAVTNFAFPPQMMYMYQGGPPSTPPNTSLSSSPNVYGGRFLASYFVVFSFTLFFCFRKCNRARKHAHLEHEPGHAAALSAVPLPLLPHSSSAPSNSTHSAAYHQLPICQLSVSWKETTCWGEVGCFSFFFFKFLGKVQTVS